MSSLTWKGPDPKVATSSIRTWPIPVFFILLNEFSERFSFHGLRSIMPSYLSSYYGMPEGYGTMVIHLFTAGSYLMGIFGAILSDVYFGKFYTILSMDTIYVLGLILFSISALPIIKGKIGAILCLVFSFMLIGIGTGGIKSNISSFSADQFDPESKKAISSVFALFYMIINCGSTLSFILMPTIRAKYDFYVTTLISAGLMTLSFVLFASGFLHYVIYDVPKISIFEKFYKTLLVAWKEKRKAKNAPKTQSVSEQEMTQIHASKTQSVSEQKMTQIQSESSQDTVNLPMPSKREFLDYAKVSIDEQFIEDIRKFLKIACVYSILPICWSLYDQSASRWIYMSFETDPHIGSIQMQPESIQLFNQIGVILSVLFFFHVLFPFLEKRGIRPNIIKHIAVGGMVLITLGFYISSIVQLFINSYSKEKKISIAALIPQYAILGIGEGLMSVSMLDFGYSHAPKYMKSLVLSLWLLTISIGNAIVSVLSFVQFSNRFWDLITYALLLTCFIILYSYFVRKNGLLQKK